MNRVFNILIILVLVMLFTACKKYPQNFLIFKSPQKVLVGGYLNAYTVNGMDSMPMWDAIYSDPTTYSNGYCPGLKAKNININNDYSDKNGFYISSVIGSGTWKFYNNKKYLHVNFNMNINNYCNVTVVPKYNLFLTSNGDWKILKLTTDGVIRIQRTYNNKVYEIEFK